MKDWMIRTIKTFVQAFFGTLIPAVCAMLNNGWPESWDKAWVVLAPTVAAGLSAAICAVWNIISEGMNTQPQGQHVQGSEPPILPDIETGEEHYPTVEEIIGEKWN